MKKKTYYRSGDVLFWYITLMCLVSSFMYIYFSDGNEYVKWFDTFMNILFPVSLVMFPFICIYMHIHRVIKYKNNDKQSIIKIEYEHR